MSARQLARDIEVNKNTAWYMGVRIRKAMVAERGLLQGIVEMDETYIGGKPRKGGNSGGSGQVKKKTKRGRGTKKSAVVAMAERGGRILAMPVKKVDAKTLSSLLSRPCGH